MAKKSEALAGENLVPLAEANRFIPAPIAAQTWRRWLERGVAGHALEIVTKGDRKFTSREAVLRFWSALTQHVGADILEMVCKPSACSSIATKRARAGKEST